MFFRNKALLELARSSSPVGPIAGYPVNWATFFKEPYVDDRSRGVIPLSRRHATIFQNVRREQGSFRVARTRAK